MAVMIDLRGSSANTKNLLRICSGPANRLKETVQSHLKVCDWEEKVTSMVPDPGEYDKFGRSTKLLIHPKDIPNVQFDKQTDNKSEILPEAENSVIEVNAISDASAKNKIFVETIGLHEGRGEFSPKAQKAVQKQMINLSKQYIACSVEEHVNDGSSRSQFEDEGNEKRWFCSPVDCVSKWSKALKQGVSNSMGLERLHTASTTAGKNEKPDFSFFL